jgi:parallel beta-helix repeat protein
MPLFRPHRVTHSFDATRFARLVLCGVILSGSLALGLQAEVVIRPRVSEGADASSALEAALGEARAHHAGHPGEPVTLMLPPGRFELSRPLVLTAEDSHVRLAGATGRRPTRLSGGVRIQGWRRNPAGGAVWEVEVPPALRGPKPFQQLFLKGERLTRSRLPKQGFFRAAAAIPAEGPIELPFRGTDLQPAWAADPDVRVVILMKWTDLHLPLKSVDAALHVANLGGRPRDPWMDEPDARYWVENVGEALSEPGEWHFDRRTGLLRLVAPPGVDPNRDPVIAPRLNRLIEVAGTADQPVRDVVLQDLVLSDADYDMPEAGLMSPQAAVVIPGSVIAHHAVGCSLVGSTLENLGGYGLELGRGCQGWTISHCTLRHLAAGGLRVGDPSDAHPTAGDANHSHLIADNILEHLGRVFAPGVGILVFHSGTNRIVHNRISDLYYTGISVGWNWGYQDTPCRENEIAYNLVEKVGQGLLSDMGGIYTLGPQPGTHIHHNLFRDIDSYGYGGWGLYTDEGSTGILLENNVVYRCKDAGFHQHYGRDNVVRNNLIAFNREHQLMRTRAESHRSFVFTNNVVVWDQGTVLGSNWSGTPDHFLLDGNLYWNTHLGSEASRYLFDGTPWDQWRARGQDRHSEIADPRLRDLSRPELGLLDGSPAYSLGFRPIDLREVGPRARSRPEAR